MREPGEKLKTDDIDLKIIRRLWDGRTPFKEIADDIGLTTNTIRSRVNRLRDNGILQIIGLVDPTAFPGTTSAIVFFKLKQEKREKALQQIGKLKNVVAAANLSSCHDIMAMVMFNEEYTHKDFIFEELKKVEGIVSVETAFPVDSVNWQLRYVL